MSEETIYIAYKNTNGHSLTITIDECSIVHPPGEVQKYPLEYCYKVEKYPGLIEVDDSPQEPEPLTSPQAPTASRRKTTRKKAKKTTKKTTTKG